MKDAEDCDKPRGAVNGPRSADVRMGKPAALSRAAGPDEHIVRPGHTGGSETSQYPEERKSNEIARVAASESAGAQTGRLAARGRGTRARDRED